MTDDVAQDLAAAARDYRDDGRNLAMRAEDRWHRLRLSIARRRGRDLTILSLSGYGTGRWVRVFSRVVMAPDSHFANGRRVAKMIADGVRGWRNFISAPVPFAEVTVRIGGCTYEVVADRGGVIDVVLEADLAPGHHGVTLEAPGADPTTADVFVIADQTHTGIVCDIDDTVVVTKLPRPFLAAWNSFVLDEHARTPTPGIAVMMERLLTRFQGAPVLYISTGAWNVAQTLTRFLTRNLYPHGPLLLTDWGPTEDRWFRSGREHKEQQLERLAQDFPDMEWILIGDDGQHDPAIYADFAHRHPEKVKVVIIRQLTYSEAVLAGGRAQDPQIEAVMAAEEDGEVRLHHGGWQQAGGRRIPWIYGPDGKAIVAELVDHGILTDDGR